ncbi:hypothetical protein E1218_08105 [Kribbella turkmenica]|uniref:DUF4352 domain-containing protein n=1 Tax=Kribbella turkmenica TaxID=2530375 RepID=A0A4R4XC99_9ACTN|nr:hypothetical protein [Kribbella turkmenica]TDD28215.1 hypothetical protein E1218_08105 [Kribbella turkmenica]
MLTALAALITAGTGLLLGLNQVGVLGESATDLPATTTPQQSSSPVPPGPSSGPGSSIAPGGQLKVALPYGQPIRVGEVAYELVSATTRPDADGKLALSLSVRMISYSRYDANFWDANFRVIVGRDTYPASGGLNELVSGDSTKVGEVLFVIPDTTRTAVLRIKFNEGDREVPFQLRPPSRARQR